MNDELNNDIINEEEKHSYDSRDDLVAQLMEMGYELPLIDYALGRGASDVSTAVNIILLKTSNEAEASGGLSFCMICQSRSDSVSLIAIPECLDSFCRDCLQSYIKLRIDEGQVLSMPCPNHECRAELHENMIHEMVPPVLYEKYLTFRNNEELSKDPFLRWCPKPDCKGYDIGSLKKHELTCNVCNFNYCYYCSEPWHPSQKCKAVNDRKMDRWAKSHGVKYCPNCRRKVEKNLGCDHMTCVKCRYEWCWLCGDRYSNHHYENCEVKKLMKKDPPMHIVLKLLFSPLIFPFACIIFCVLGVSKLINSQDVGRTFRRFLMHKTISYPLAALVGLVLTPLFFALGPFVVAIGVCIDCYKKCLGNKCCVVVSSGILTGTIAAPVLLAVGLIALVLAHLAGLFLISYKLCIFIRRCKDPYYLLPRSKYGYI